MLRDTPSLARPGVVTALTVALLLLPLESCLEPTSVDCGPGLACPAGQKCAARQEVCIKTDCGDGIIQAGEMCDDGNIIEGDGCSRTCDSDERCGNGKVDVNSAQDISRREVCDDGNNTDGDGCSANCLSNEFCGNGIVDQSVGEKCDDGNKESGDGCSGDCLSNELCGNGYLDLAKREKCDDGGNDSGDGCSGDCKSDETCGNGIIDVAVGEVCDDRNNELGDGCSANCKSNETCGNGIVDSPVGEVCDDGNQLDGDACSATCKGPGVLCGNGKLDPAEQCDDGNVIPTDDCNNDCKVTTCGDGSIDKDSSRHEQCDDAGESASCNINCTKSACGDGVVNASAREVCDDRNVDACGTCNSKCTRAQDPQQARGSIIAQFASDIGDGAWFSIDDGYSLRFFEFDKDSSVIPGSVAVDIQGANNPNEVANAIKDAINGASGFKIDAAADWNVVWLTHQEVGELGNHLILKSLWAGGYIVDGMSGGSADAGCDAGVGCRYDQDCTSGRCRSGTCQ